MNPIKSVLIVGAGAIGAAIASRIYDVDPKAVALCASGPRRERYAREGFIINDTRYSFRLSDPENPEEFDLIIVAVKNYDLSEAIRELRPFVGPRTTILSLLNGVTSEDVLRAEFGLERVPLAFIIGIDALRIGNRIDFPRPGEVRFGEEKNSPESPSPRVAAIARFFESHNVPFSVPKDMVRDLWFKFMLNVAVNQWSAVLRAPYGLFQRSESARKLLSGTMREVIAVSRAENTGLTEGDMETVFTTLSRLGAEGRTSMLQDVDAKRKTEVDAFAGVIVEKASHYGIPVPLNEALLLAVRAMEETA